jgi:hypothetical protein
MGPWARSFVAALAGRAERPALDVSDLRVDPGVLTARVEDCEVTISATVIPQRIWRAVESYADPTMQSVHLEHVLEEDWEELLIPRPRSIQRSCTCDGEDCEHVVAAAWAFADAIDARPRVLLHWRGIDGGDRPASVVSDPWRGGELPEIPPPRKFPRHAVLERLGPSGMEVQGEDLAVVLRRAYDRLGG